jgi:acid phosphatase
VEPAPVPASGVPDFSHVIIIVMENREFGSVIGNPAMPNYNQWAEENTLLSQYYAIRHPSLPNYVALIGGDTFGITVTCETCYIDAPSLPDLIEASGRTWRTYQENMPRPCFLGSTLKYGQKHNPFIYFDSIREDKDRCWEGIVPLTELENDLNGGSLPDFVFITPNLCNSGHDCSSSVIDHWLEKWVPRILDSPAFDERSLLVLTWDEGQGNHTCCNLETGGGRIATLLISPLARPGFQDDTPYTHYSLLKTISEAWGLEKLGNAASPDHALITAPWVTPIPSP